MSASASGNDNLTARLQRRVTVYFASGILGVGALIALVTIIPLYLDLTSLTEEKLQFVARTHAQIVEENLFRIRSVAQQVTSRTKAREQLEALNRGDIEIDAFTRVTRPILLDALDKTDSLLGITRLNIHEEAVLTVGDDIPANFWPVPDDNVSKTTLLGPVSIDGERRLVVGAPILNRRGERVGTDITLFKLGVLASVVGDYTGLENTGEIILGELHPDGVRIFFTLRDEAITGRRVFSMTHPMGIALSAASQGREGLFSAEVEGRDVVIAYRPIQGSSWGILVKMDKSEVHADIRTEVVLICTALLLLMILGTWGVLRLLQPLSGKMVLREDELQVQIQEKTQALESELLERKRAEDEARNTAGQLAKSNEALEQFASIAAHDLKEPLRKVSMFGERLLKSATNLDSKDRKYLEVMLNSTFRMRALIDSLLDYTRVTSSEVKFEATDLNEVLDDVKSDLEELIRDNQAVVNVDRLPTIPADSHQMRQLFQNLVTNSLRYRHEDVAPQISIELDDRGHAENVARILIRDNGIGFEQAQAEKIFQAFKRLHSRQQFAGTGIGLSVCQRIVERHHGSIKATGSPGEGAVFIIDLPLEQKSGSRQ